jgi:hypothetical protein
VFALSAGDLPPILALRATVRRLSSQHAPAHSGSLTFVSAELPGQAYGRALAHWRDGRFVAYCAREDLTSHGAAVMTTVASAAATATAIAASGSAGIRFGTARHDAMLDAAIHPAMGVINPDGLTLIVCADLLAPALAGVLTRLAAESFALAQNRGALSLAR